MASRRKYTYTNGEGLDVIISQKMWGDVMVWYSKGWNEDSLHLTAKDCAAWLRSYGFR